VINTAHACNNVQNANNDDEDNVANSNEQASNKNDAADVDADAAEVVDDALQMMLIMTTVVMIDWRRSSLMMVWNLAMRWMTASMIFMELFLFCHYLVLQMVGNLLDHQKVDHTTHNKEI
jgi:hypothetical protein